MTRDECEKLRREAKESALTVWGDLIDLKMRIAELGEMRAGIGRSKAENVRGMLAAVDLILDDVINWLEPPDVWSGE